MSLLVSEHANGSVTVQALGFDGLTEWGLDEAAVRETVELAVSDRLERSHPGQLHRRIAPRGRELNRYEIDGVIEVLPRARDVAVPVDVISEPEPTSVRLWLPQLDARIWVPEGESVQERVSSHVQGMAKAMSHARRASIAPAPQVRLVDLDLEVERAPLEAFTGDNLGLGLLPVVTPSEEVEQRREHVDGRKPTPTLDRLAFHPSGPSAFGRDEIVAQLVRMLDKPVAMVLVGPAGCGKTTVAHQVAASTPRTCWYCDASRLVTERFDGWRSQVLDVVEELGANDDVWFCGDPVQLLDAGKHVGSEMNAAQLLKPFLSAGQLRVLGECTEASWARLEARAPGFARLFTPVRLTDPDAAQLPMILDAIAGELPVPVRADGVAATLEIARRYGPADALLGTAARFMRRLSAEAVAREQFGPLGRDEVIARFCAESGMPELLVRDELALDPDEVRALLAERVIGQDEAVDRLVELIALIKGGMSDLGRPLGSFLLVGPTGVGKTESAKALASWLFGDARRLLRFDMSEFSGPDCLQRLLDPESGLVARVRTQPFCVVLLDEIEKAHDAVFDLLLQVLGEARLSDAQGTTADFRNAVVLMTSNLGVGTFRRPTGFGADPSAALQSHVRAEVERFFRPELFNRIDRVVAFASLGREVITSIARRELEAMLDRPGLRSRGIQVDIDPAVIDWLAERGTDPRYGARPLKRAIATDLVAPLARHLSSQSPSRVVVRVRKGRLRFENAEASKRHGGVAPLRDQMVLASELRFVVQALDGCEQVRRARREVQLADRLMQSKRFWRDREAAEARSRAVEPLGAVLVSIDELRSEIEAVEELAHEHFVARDAAAVEAIGEQIAEVQRSLQSRLVDVAGMREVVRDTAHLRFWVGNDDSEPFLAELVAAYVELATIQGWRIAIGATTWEPGKNVYKLLAMLRKQRQATAVIKVEGPGAALLLAAEGGVHELRTDSEPQRVRVGFDASRAPLEAPAAVVRVWDRRKKQLRCTRARLTTTLGASEGDALLALARLNLCIGVLGDQLGTRVWRGLAWS